MAEPVLRVGRHQPRRSGLGDGHHRVVAEAARFSPRRGSRHQRPVAISGSGSSAAALTMPPARDEARAPASGARPARASSRALSASWRPPRSARGHGVGSRLSRIVRRDHARRALPSAFSTHRPESRRRSPPGRWRLSGTTRLGQRVLDEARGAAPRSRPTHARRSKLDAGRPRASAPSSLSFLALFDASTSRSASIARSGPGSLFSCIFRAERCCSAISSRMPLSARPIRRSISSRARARLGGAPCTDEAARAGHHHVHVGVAGRVLDIFEVEQRRAVEQVHRDRRHMVADRRLGQQALRQQLRHRVVRGATKRR